MIDPMSPNTKLLFEAFQSDHANLAKDLYALRISLSEGQAQELRSQAAYILETAGAHIAFEEFDFYPILKPMLEHGEINRMYLEHAQGLEVIKILAECKSDIFENKRFLVHALAGLQKLEHHIADCRNLFWAVCALEDSQSLDLLERLNNWHKKAPSWQDLEGLTADIKKAC